MNIYGAGRGLFLSQIQHLNINHFEYESDLRSNEHYLSSSEKKA